MKAVDSKQIRERVAALREKMKERGFDAYLIVTDDFHASEYVGDYFKCREFISGFDGSAGSVVVLADRAGLWTDGRYFLQAEEQLKDTGITLYRMRDEGVPELEDFLHDALPEGSVLGFDGRTVSSKQYKKLRKKLGDRVKIEMKTDLIGELWSDRPALSAEPVFELAVEYAGKSRAEKLKELRETLTKKQLDGTVIASLDDIAWLLNIRGNDIAYNPVVLSYLIVTTDAAEWFVNLSIVNNEIKLRLENDGIVLRPYDSFYDALGTLGKGKKLLLDPERSNAAITDRLIDVAEITEEMNLTTLPKAKKNEVEIENTRAAHIKDGVAVTRFIYWLKQTIGKEEITETAAAKKLEEFRQQGEHYYGQSFAPITGYGAHGAIMHYEATEATDIPLGPKSFFLVDTGGQYLEGTTDITRTIALGPLTDEQKTHYTAVLRGNLNLAAAYFKQGCTGLTLDYLAREAIWKLNLDYNHGTGHGVGYFLNVHEGPQGIRSTLFGDPATQIMEPGMITSDEPGLYFEGQYGIRIENLMVCLPAEKNEYGQFLHFETLTLVPHEREAIDVSQMTAEERALLNAYHKKVYETIGPLLPAEEREWLFGVTKPF